jgi:predicted GNAT family acetyltransferase
VAPVSRVAAIGNVYTAAEARRRGYGAATTAGVVRALLEKGYERIVLNVSIENATAIRVYERLGFVAAVEYWETDHAGRRVVR